MADKKPNLYQRENIWYFRKNGKRLSLRTTDENEAERMRDQLLENYRISGKFTVCEEFPDEEISSGDDLIFGKIATDWAKIHEKKVKYSTWRDYRSCMNKQILPVFQHIPINEIKYQDVEKFISELTCGPKRVNNILVPMRGVFQYAFKSGYVDENVMLKVDNRSVEIPDIFPFSHDEVLQIIEATEPFYRPYVKTRFYTGMRDGEINALEWSDYKTDMKPYPQFYIKKVFVYGLDGRTKTKKSKRYIDCISFVQDALEEHLKNITDKKSKYIFLTKTGQRMSPDHFRNVVWKKALKKAGLEYRPPMQTRHTFATMMISAGEDIGWVKTMLGHSSLQMIFTRYYSWIPRKTRLDGSAFAKSISSNEPEKILDEVPKMTDQSNVIYLFK